MSGFSWLMKARTHISHMLKMAIDTEIMAILIIANILNILRFFKLVLCVTVSVKWKSNARNKSYCKENNWTCGDDGLIWHESINFNNENWGDYKLNNANYRLFFGGWHRQEAETTKSVASPWAHNHNHWVFRKLFRRATETVPKWKREMHLITKLAVHPFRLRREKYIPNYKYFILKSKLSWSARMCSLGDKFFVKDW